MKPILSGVFITLLIAAATPCSQAADFDEPLATDDAKAVALYQACDKNDLDEAKNQVMSGAPIDGAVGKYRFTPLINAATNGRADILKFLVDYHANLNLADSEGSTPLLHACWENHANTALALIDAGADVNLGSLWGRTPLMYAARKGNDQIVAALIAHKAALNTRVNASPAICWAASNGRLSTVKLLGDAGADPNLLASSGDMYTALSCATGLGNLEMIDYLISIHADVNKTDHEGQTPLMISTAWSKPDAAERLVAAGTRVDTQDNQGKTALILAAEAGQMGIVRVLVSAQANLDLTDKNGSTALLIAGNVGETAIVDFLKRRDAKMTQLHVIVRGADSPKLTPAHAFGLAVGAIYAQRDGANPRALGGDRERAASKKMLKRDWGIHDKPSLLEELDDLRDHGHHTAFREEGEKWAQLSDGDFEKHLEEHPLTAARDRPARASYLKWKNRTGLAWDLCREANLASQGVTAGYFTADEGWDRLLALGRRAQVSFTSWQELSDNFLDGREIWAGARDPRFDACAKLLLNPQDPNSPWNKSPWKTDLSGK